MTPPETPPTHKPLTGLQLDLQLRRVLLIGYMVIAAGVIYAMSVMWPLIRLVISILLPFVTALVLAYVMNPIVTFLSNRLRLRRVGGLLVFYLIVGLIGAGFLGWVLPILFKQSRAAFIGVTETIPARVNALLRAQEIDPGILWERADQFAKSHGYDVGDLLKQVASSNEAQEAAKSAASGGARVIQTFLVGILDVALGLFRSIIFLAFVIVISFYFIIDFAKFRGILEILIPDKHEDRIFEILKKCDTAVGGFLRGQIISAMLVGLLVAIGLTFLGMGQYALLIGVIATVGNLIPYLGPVLAGAPAVLYMILSDRFSEWDDKLTWAGVTVAMFIAIQQIDGWVFQPRIVGRAAQLHPVVVLLALIAGASFGFMGMIVAVPCAAIARVLLKEFYWDKRELEWHHTTGKRRFDDPPSRVVKKQASA